MKQLLLAMLMWVVALAPAWAEQLSPEELVAMIRQGGYVIYFRHAATDHSQRDVDRKNLDNCATQRNLNETGKRQAMAIGKGFAQQEIPVGKVLSSPWCRAKDTAYFAFGRAEVVPNLGFSIAKSTEETERLSAALHAMLSSVPESGTNTLLFSHTSNLKEATGVWPKPEGVMAIFKPTPDVKRGYTYYGMIPPEYWLDPVR